MNFSVLISVYYRDDHLCLDQAIRSVITQTCQPSEIVIVKDGSLTPILDSVLETFVATSPIPVKLVPLPKNVGLGLALQTGLQSCSYNWVARMDSDDLSLPQRFEKQTQLIKEKQLDAVSAWIEEFDVTPGDLKRVRKLPTEHQQLVQFSQRRNPLNHPCAFFNKNAVMSVGSYESMPLFEDYYLWLKLIQNGYRIGNLPEVLLYFRVGNGMIRRRHGWEYLKKELKFYYRVMLNGLIPPQTLVVSVLLRLPLRLLPIRLLQFLYEKVVRY
ncbi:glycosyltransferase [Cylindrospermopsis raciborskii DSH]|uniref:glycosyltransferase n=1 Tax=Cylindrospermopsis raciborskii TaxID=77022 RepID=UPI002ED8A7DB